MTTWDSSFVQDGHTLLLGGTASEISLLSFHPQPVHIFRLWQTFLDNVNPLLRILHAPTVQHQILEATADLGGVPRNLEALMFCIYHFAVVSLDGDECQNLFGVEKSSLLKRYQTAARQALLNVSFLKTSDLTVLQALTLYLVGWPSSLSVKSSPLIQSPAVLVVDPLSLYCLTGIAVRIGQRLGLDRDAAGRDISPFDLEMRRRLWWQIALLDSRVGELTGALNSVLTQPWTTKFPLNVNDSDLYPDMKEPPLESKGVTEVTFFLLRCEIGAFLRRSGEAGKGSGQAGAIDELDKYIELKYLNHCDSQIPLHLMSKLMAKSAISKMRLTMQYRFPRITARQENTPPSAEKDIIFSNAIKMLEYHNSMLSSKPSRRFLWYIHKSHPFPAIVYLLAELRNRPIDPMADQAWQAMIQSLELRKDLTARPIVGDSPLHAAICNLTIKAWEAKEHALCRMRLPVSVPSVMSNLRDQTMSRRAQTPRFCQTSHPSTPAESSSGGHHLTAMSQYPNVTNIYATEDTLQQPAAIDMEMTDSTFMNWDFWGTLMSSSDIDDLQRVNAPQAFYQT